MNESNETTLEQKIAVMQAAKDGKKIEWACRSDEDWEPFNVEKCEWDWRSFQYRVAVEPREFWINEYQDGTALTLGAPRESKQMADEAVKHISVARIRCIHVREVLE